MTEAERLAAKSSICQMIGLLARSPVDDGDLFRTLADTWFAMVHGGHLVNGHRARWYNKRQLTQPAARHALTQVARYVSPVAWGALQDTDTRLVKDHGPPISRLWPMVRASIRDNDLNDNDIDGLLAAEYGVALISGGEHRNLPEWDWAADNPFHARYAHLGHDPRFPG